MRSRLPARASLLVTAVALSVLVPVAPGVAQVAQPEVVTEELTDLPEQVTAASGTHRLSEAVETPIPFSMVGFELPAGVDELEVRGRVDGEWTTWFPAEAGTADDAPDAESQESAGIPDPTTYTEPVWIGEADALQLRVPDGGDPAEVGITLIDSLGLTEGIVTRIGRYLSARPQPAEAAAVPFPVVTRAEWGADESLRGHDPNYASTVKFAVVHHTAGGNSYSKAQAPGVVRGIYAYHTGKGWADVGYNFLIDNYGTVYEGRYGGMDRAVQGAHAAGYNSGSTGVSLLGNYESAVPSSAAIRAFRDVIAWKFAVHGVAPSASAQVSHNGRSLSTIVGHRDIGATACPGANLYSKMGSLRTAVAKRVADFAGQAPSGWVPVVGDWDGDGVDTPGMFRDGRWLLHDRNDARGNTLRFGYGTAGDLPVVGDWNGDGRDTVGIVRDGTWHLRNANSGGNSHHSFSYGRGAVDWPLAGDWKGTGVDRPGIVRDGEWHLRHSLSGGAGQVTFTYGRVSQGDLPFVGDWNDDGSDTPGIIRDGAWHLRNSYSDGWADATFKFGRVSRGDLPVIGDWNGNGADTIGILRGTDWHQQDRLAGGTATRSFSFGGD